MFRNSFRVCAVLAVALIALALPANADDKPAKPKTSKIRISKETTFLLKPVRKEGFVDYESGFNMRLGKGVTAKNNAVVAVLRILGPEQFSGRTRVAYFAKLGIKVLPDVGNYFVTMREFALQQAGVKHREYAKKLYAESKQAIARPWSPREYPKLAGWLKANRKHLDAALLASERGHWFSPVVVLGGPLVAAIIPMTQEAQRLPHGLLARAMQRSQQGDAEQAIRDLIAAQRLGRLAGGRFLIDSNLSYQLDSMAHKALLAMLRSGKLADGELTQYQQTLDRLPPLSPTTQGLVGARITALDAVEYVFKSHFGGLNDISIMTDDLFRIDARKVGKHEARFFGLIDWNEVLVQINREYDMVHAVVSQPRFANRKEAMAKYARALKERQNGIDKRHTAIWKSIKNGSATRKSASHHMANLIVCLLATDPTMMRMNEDAATTRADLTRIAVALERHRIAAGKFPSRLANLGPRFLQKIPQDLFTGKPLRYVRSKAGYLLYSVGPNMKDDGGRQRGTVKESDDIVVRMKLAK